MKTQSIAWIAGVMISTAAMAASAAESPLGAGGKLDGKLQHKFEENDTNRDGFISKDEWQTRGERMFGERDANRDGKLSQEEMKSYRDSRREKFRERREAFREKREERREGQGAKHVPVGATSATPATGQNH